MRCMLCESFSLFHICPSCQRLHLTPQWHHRTILGSIPVYSFYPYSDIEPLLLTKHTDLGYYIYSILAKNAFRPFAQTWHFKQRVASVGIDDGAKSGYSHTAVLNRTLGSSMIIPYYGKLRASYHYKYAGKSVQERLLNPRKFIYQSFKEDEVILVDDIVTTGSTLTEAVETLAQYRKKVILCLTLSDAENR